MSRFGSMLLIVKLSLSVKMALLPFLAMNPAETRRMEADRGPIGADDAPGNAEEPCDQALHVEVLNSTDVAD